MTIEIPLMWGPQADRTLPVPHYATTGAAGADVVANFPEDLRASGLTLAPMQRALVPTGLHMAIPFGYELQIRPRSGLAYKHGLTVANAPGTIDCDYRGEVKVLMINLGTEPFDITHGMRVAQGVIAPAPQVQWTVTDHLPETERGAGGFGSTGVHGR